LRFLPILLICLATVPNVQANTGITSILNLQYPSQAVLQNGVAQVTVTFTVYYSDYWNPQGFLIFGVWSIAGASYVKGSAASTPYPCQSLTGTSLAGDAVCAVVSDIRDSVQSEFDGSISKWSRMVRCE
jgi:hypothetical protein